jgi:hypothetical protein
MSPALDLGSREFKVAAACIAISIGLHAAFLLVARVGSFDEAFSNVPASSGVHVRLIAAEPIGRSTGRVVGARVAAFEADPPTRRAQRPPVSVDARISPRRYSAARVRRESYLPLGKLTRAPSPIRPVAVPYPEGTAITGNVVARLTLFIDEEGNVARVVVGSTELPDAFVQAAKDAFEPAKFRPGLIDDTAVKVRMVVDVEFEDRGEKRPKAQSTEDVLNISASLFKAGPFRQNTRL